MQDLFTETIPALIAISFVGLIALTIATVHDGKEPGTDRSELLKRLYVYLVSFMTLLLVASATASVLNNGLRWSVFTKADPVSGSYEMPPSLYLSSSDGKEILTTDSSLVCSGSCVLTDLHRQDIAAWVERYQSWKEANGTGTVRARGLITPLSFLLIAGLVFLFHWRFAKRDASMTRQTYFWSMSFIWLVAAVFSLGFLVNTTLRAVLPGQDVPGGRVYPIADVVGSSTSAVAPDTYLTQGIAAIQSCATDCGLSDETLSLANGWQADYDVWSERTNAPQRSEHNSFATQLAFALVSVPLFWYHFRSAWKKKEEGI